MGEAGEVANFAYNWWNTPSGPTADGVNGVQGPVVSAPWLTQDPGTL